MSSTFTKEIDTNGNVYVYSCGKLMLTVLNTISVYFDSSCRYLSCVYKSTSNVDPLKMVVYNLTNTQAFAISIARSDLFLDVVGGSVLLLRHTNDGANHLGCQVSVNMQTGNQDIKPLWNGIDLRSYANKNGVSQFEWSTFLNILTGVKDVRLVNFHEKPSMSTLKAVSKLQNGPHGFNLILERINRQLRVWSPALHKSQVHPRGNIHTTIVCLLMAVHRLRKEGRLWLPWEVWELIIASMVVRM